MDPSRPRAAPFAIALLALLVLSAPAGAQGLGGRYGSPLGELRLVEKDGVVLGKTTKAGGPCGFVKGKVVLEGTRLDDNITGTIRACRQGPSCTGELEGLVMLLITRSGGLLSGAVHLDSGACRTPVGVDGLTLRRRPDKAARSKRGTSGASTSEGVERARGKRGKGKGERARAEALATEAARLMEVGSIEEARAKFEKSTEADPSYSQGYVGVGVTYYVRDRYDEALSFYKKGLEANPANRDAYYNTACVYALKGNAEQAIRYLEIAVLNGYVQLETLASDPDLKSLRGNADFERIRTGGF